MSIEIQERDIKILKFVFACRVVSYGQIARRFFPNAERTIARRRIRKLAAAGFIRINAARVFGLTAETVQPLPALWPLIRETFPFEVDRPHFKSESPEHDIRVAEVFMRLEKLSCFRSFVPENLLQSSAALASNPKFGSLTTIQSDGALSVCDDKGDLKLYAVEVEISKKSAELYRKKLIDYFLARGIDGVFYISPKQEILDLVAKVQAAFTVNRAPIVRFATEQNVLKSPDKLIFAGSDENGVELI